MRFLLFIFRLAFIDPGSDSSSVFVASSPAKAEVLGISFSLLSDLVPRFLPFSLSSRP